MSDSASFSIFWMGAVELPLIFLVLVGICVYVRAIAGGLRNQARKVFRCESCGKAKHTSEEVVIEDDVMLEDCSVCRKCWKEIKAGVRSKP